MGICSCSVPSWLKYNLAIMNPIDTALVRSKLSGLVSAIYGAYTAHCTSSAIHRDRPMNPPTKANLSAPLSSRFSLSTSQWGVNIMHSYCHDSVSCCCVLIYFDIIYCVTSCFSVSPVFFSPHCVFPFIISPVLFPPHSPHLSLIPLLVCRCI